jgi:hypothetical protein
MITRLFRVRAFAYLCSRDVNPCSDHSLRGDQIAFLALFASEAATDDLNLKVDNTSSIYGARAGC